MFQSNKKKKSFFSQLFGSDTSENRFTVKELGLLHQVLDANANVHEVSVVQKSERAARRWGSGWTLPTCATPHVRPRSAPHPPSATDSKATGLTDATLCLFFPPPFTVSLLLRASQGNKDTVVEALRSIAELMIWGDQHDPSFFEFFAEHHTLSYFRRILDQPYCRSGEVAVQILQTLSILTQNIQSEQAIYFLFSNNHVNQIIAQDFNFKDDEVLGYYISFLKTISLKLNAGTVQFFFLKRRLAEGSDEMRVEFPFYSRIIQFFRHEESMVRAAVRTCTLNIYSVKDAGVREFLQNSREASEYIQNLGKYVMEQCQALAVILPATRQGTIDPKRLDVALEELDDIFYYCYDVYSLFEEGVGEKLMCVLWKDLHSVVLEPFRVKAGGDREQTPTAGGDEGHTLGSCRLTVSLLILERLFHILHIPGLLNATIASLFLPKTKALKLAPLIWTADVDAFSASSAGGADSWYSAWPVFRRCVEDETKHVESTLCVRFLTKCIKSKCLSEDVMDEAGLLPRRLKTSRMLFNELTSIDSDPSTGASSTGRVASSKKKGHRRAHSSEEIASMQLFPTDQGGQVAEAGDGEDIDSVARKMEDCGVDEGRGGVAKEDEDEEAPYLMFANLISEPFRVDLVNLVGWMLSQWLPLDSLSRNSSSGTKASAEENREVVFSPRKGDAQGGRTVPEALARVLDKQMKDCVAELRVHLHQSWCDGLPLLVSRAWRRNKRHLISPQVSMNAVETAAFLLRDHSVNKLSRAPKGSPGMNTAIAAARQGNEAVNAFVAMAQLKIWIETGDMPNDPSAFFGLQRGLFSLDEPVGLVPHDRRPLPVSDGSEVNLDSINLIGQDGGKAIGGQAPIVAGALPCRVAFTRGAERNVYFCSDGRHALSSVKQKTGQRELGSVCIFLADANESVSSSSSRTFAKVVAMAPLAGAEPAIDPTHPAWLHLRVRPPLSAFTAVCGMMNASQSFGQPNIKGKRPKLNDGRWTLAFEDAESARKAEEMIHRQREQLRANAEDLLCNFAAS